MSTKQNQLLQSLDVYKLASLLDNLFICFIKDNIPFGDSEYQTFKSINSIDEKKEFLVDFINHDLLECAIKNHKYIVQLYQNKFI